MGGETCKIMLCPKLAPIHDTGPMTMKLPSPLASVAPPPLTDVNNKLQCQHYCMAHDT